ncbi:MAG: hypothetical protein M0027_08915 [Candidatus Dormibacteraeota bacterium]|nr:hypothetical protein [Candidatus Dormibacteraeota bacterium]
MELGVGGCPCRLLGRALAGGVGAEAGDDQTLGALVADQACDAAADHGGMGFQVGAGDLDCLLVGPLDCVPGVVIAEGPDDGDGLGGGEGAVDGGGVDAVGMADQLLAGVGVLALPEAEKVVAVHLAGEAEGDRSLAEPLPGPLGGLTRMAQVVVAATALRPLAGKVSDLARGVPGSDLVDGHQNRNPSISPTPAQHAKRTFCAEGAAVREP